MDVDTRLLRSFVAVAEEGTLTRAAERVYVSQPALTKQIKQLETQLGVRLFTRSRTGMTLTASGRALAERTPASGHRGCPTTPLEKAKEEVATLPKPTLPGVDQTFPHQERGRRPHV